jgi:phage-related protein
LIPIFQSWWAFISDILIPGIIDTFQPILAGLQKAFGYIADSIQKNSDKLAPFFALIQAIAKFIVSTLAPALGTVLGAALTVIGKAISVVIDLFARLVGIINLAVDAIRSLVSFVKNNPLVAGIGNVIDNVFGGGRAAGGPVMGGTSYLVGEKGPEIFTPSSTGFITPNNKLGGSTVINLNVTGAIDPEGTARSIINVLNNSYYRGTNGAAALVF